MSAAALPAISAVGSLLGGSGLFKGKKTEMMNPMTPGAQRVSGAQENYIMGGLNKPIAYAGVNQASNTALDTLMRMFFGQSYNGGGPSFSAPGGGPQQGPPQFPQQPSYGMPQQMGRQMPPGIPPQGFPQGVPMGGRPQQMGPQMPYGPFRGYYGR